MVLRRFANVAWLAKEPDLVAHEAAALARAGQGAVPISQLAAYLSCWTHPAKLLFGGAGPVLYLA